VGVLEIQGVRALLQTYYGFRPYCDEQLYYGRIIIEQYGRNIPNYSIYRFVVYRLRRRKKKKKKNNERLVIPVLYLLLSSGYEPG
jgi:hypothetical protein